MVHIVTTALETVNCNCIRNTDMYEIHTEEHYY